MKLTSLLAIASLAFAGAACSEAAAPEAEADLVSIETDDTTGPKLNLSLPGSGEAPPSGGLNLGAGPAEDDGLMIGGDALSEPNLGDDITVEIPAEGEVALEMPDEDAIVSLPQE